MKKIISIPNLLTLYRIFAMIPIALLIASQRIDLYLIAAILIILAYLSDALDGVAARALNQTSLFGSRFDIAGDRVHELSLWIIFATAGVFPSIMGVLFIVRGFITDTIREQAAMKNIPPFEMIKTPLGRSLVSARWSRALIGALKMIVFLSALTTLTAQQIWPTQASQIHYLTLIIGWLAVGFNLLRGAPVVVEGLKFFDQEET